MDADAPARIQTLPGVPHDAGNGVVVASPRGRLLDAMTASVAEKGYAATSVADVIKRAHASRSTFYEHFDDKEDCYLAAYQFISDHLARVVTAASPDTPVSIAEHVALHFNAYLNELVRYPMAARAFIVEIRAAGAPTQQHRRAIYDQFADLARIPGADDDQVTRTAVIVLSEEIIARQIADHGTDHLLELAPTLTKLATRLLTSTTPS